MQTVSLPIELARHLLASSPAVIYTCAASGDYSATFVSDNITALLGYSPEEFLHDPGFWKNHLHSDDREQVFAGLRALNTHRRHVHEYRFLAKSGEYRWMRDELRLVCNPVTGVDELVGSWLDITKRKTAEESLRQSEESLRQALQQAQLERDKTNAILEAMADGISIQDTELRVLYQNAAHRRRMGEHRGEFCYQAYQQRAEACPGCHLLQSFADGQVHVREATASPYGELRHFEIVSAPLFDSTGRLIAGIEAVRDITPRKRAEESLQQKTRELEESNRELEAFSYTLSHDLRSFLARIDLAGEALQEFEGARLANEGRYFLQTILDNCQNMDRLISTMLTLAHISREQLCLEMVDLSAMAEGICEQMAKAEPERGWRFAITPGIKVSGDVRLLRVALENLLGNAGKYTRDKAVAEISLTAHSGEGRQVVAVTDNGSGFDMGEATKLFQPFARLSGARDFPGFGIGLTTVERIIKRHGGEIWAEATPGAGATFFFSLG